MKYLPGLLAAMALLASCTLQQVPTPDSPERTITATFLKSTLGGENGRTPQFEQGDRIKVFNGVETPQECTISVASGKAQFTTTLQGTLTAIYPASAAKTNGNQFDGITVPAIQDGTFASANISQAEIPDGAGQACFQNRTALFVITPGAGQDTEYVELIAPSGKIRVNSRSARTVYISLDVTDNLTLGDISFADGHNLKTIEGNGAAKTIERNTIYTINDSGWDEPYIEAAGLKWATGNVGAENPGDSGLYFAWDSENLAPYLKGSWRLPTQIECNSLLAVLPGTSLVFPKAGYNNG